MGLAFRRYLSRSAWLKALIRGSHGAPCALLVSALWAGTGCATNEQSIFIRQINVPAEGSSKCAVQADPTSLSLSHGTLDVALRSQYSVYLLVGNQMVSQGSRQQLRGETSRVRLEGSEVTAIDDVTSATVFGPVSIPGAGFVDPSDGTTPGWGLIMATLFGPNQDSAGMDLVATLRAAPYNTSRGVTSHVRVFGHTLGGTGVESAEFLFPIRICNGCLVSFPSTAVDTTAPRTPNCDKAAEGEADLAAPCSIGQDETVDCRVCKQYLGDAAVCEPYR